VVLILALVLFCSTAFAQRKYVGWSTGYHTTWGGQAVGSMFFNAYTHIVYFDGGITMTNQSTGQSFTSTCHANKCKAIKCLGGAGAGGSFSSSTSSGSLANYVSTVISAMQAQGYDGLDVDWEDGINNAQYLALCQALRNAMNAITPRPLLTVATADYFSGSTIPAAGYFDQINLMSYWTDVNGMAGELNSFTSKGVAKSLLGVGYGYDTDGETDVNNPNDVGAKCLYAINNGYGGVMVWEIARACTACNDTTAYYVNKNAVVPVMPMLSGLMQNGQRVLFSVSNGTGIGVSEIRYSVPSSQVVNLSLFNMKGALVQNLANGMQSPGNYVIPVGRYTSRTRVSPGVYVAKMASPASTESGMVVVK
jgi:Glycosyl hydrolases family 18